MIKIEQLYYITDSWSADIANYYMRDESNPSSEFWDITPYNDPKQKGGAVRLILFL